MSDVVYAEDASPPAARRAVLVGMAVVVGLALLGQDSLVAGLLVGALLASLLGGLALLTLWSMDRYGRIRLTPQVLRVGRHRVPVADLDPRALLQQAGQSPQLAARWPQSAGVDLSDAPLLVRPPLLGGGFTEPVGAQSLLLLTRDGQWRRVPTRRPDDLLQALLTLTVR